MLLPNRKGKNKSDVYTCVYVCHVFANILGSLDRGGRSRTISGFKKGELLIQGT